MTNMFLYSLIIKTELLMTGVYLGMLNNYELFIDWNGTGSFEQVIQNEPPPPTPPPPSLSNSCHIPYEWSSVHSLSRLSLTETTSPTPRTSKYLAGSKLFFFFCDWHWSLPTFPSVKKKKNKKKDWSRSSCVIVSSPRESCPKKKGKPTRLTLRLTQPNVFRSFLSRFAAATPSTETHLMWMPCSLSWSQRVTHSSKHMSLATSFYSQLTSRFVI